MRSDTIKKHAVELIGQNRAEKLQDLWFADLMDMTHRNSEWPYNLIDYASEGQMRQLDKDVSVEVRIEAGKIIEEALHNCVDEESANRLVDLYKGRLRWVTFMQHKDAFKWVQFISNILRAAVGKPSSRNPDEKFTEDEMELYGELRIAFIKAHVLLNQSMYPHCILKLVDRYPEIALDTEKLVETMDYLRKLIEQMSGRDVFGELCEHINDDELDEILRYNVESIQDIFDKYANTPLMDVEKTISDYAIKLEDELTFVSSRSRYRMDSLINHLKKALGWRCKIDTVEEGIHTKIRIAINMSNPEDEDEEKELDKAVEFLVMICDDNEIRALPAQEMYIENPYVTGVITL